MLIWNKFDERVNYMKNFWKFFASVFTVFLFGLVATNTSYASENLSDEEALNRNEVQISITNDETGEVTYIEPVETESIINNTKSMMSLNSMASNDESIVVGYDVFIPIESSITTYDSSGSQKTEGGVTAKLYVDYDVSSNNEQVRLNKVYGSWTPSSNMYSLSNRTVDAHSGSGTGKKLSKKPSSNSFSYSTGWGYNNRVWGDASPRAWSSAKISISGMTATHTIKVEFTYS